MFLRTGLHFIHLNIPSLLPKIEELRYIAESTNATAIGICESKLVLDPEISFILVKSNILNNKSFPSHAKSYLKFRTFFGLKQLIIVPTMLASSSSAITDHILASLPERVTQSGVIDIGLPDHQLIYCIRKIYRIDRGSQKQIKFLSLKHYAVDLFKK